jgi:transcriptional regulator with XRE-family HTH domain
VSQASGVSQQAISYYEKKPRQPSLECLAKVSKALDWELSKLIAEAERRLG